jgi:hypothetical protein
MRRRSLSHLPLLLGLAALLAACARVGPAEAQAPAPYAAEADSLAAAADTLGRSHPDRTPYVTRRSLLYRTFAAPAYLLHEAIRPVRWTVRWADRNGVFDRIEAYYFRDSNGPPAVRGIVPTAGLGGPIGFTVGARAFHNDLFGTGRRAGVLAQWGGPGAYRVRGQLANPRVVRGLSFTLAGGYRVAPDITLYGVGNAATLEDNVVYRTTTLDLSGVLDLGVVGPFAVFAEGTIDRTGTLPRRFQGDGAQVATGAAGLSGDLDDKQYSVVAFAGGGARFDAVRAGALGIVGTRPLAGLQFRAGYGYGQDVYGNAFGFHRFYADALTFLPVGRLLGLPANRRIEARFYVEQSRPNQGQQVPFYHLAALGGEDILRGYRYQRFRDEGAALAAVAYLWPLHRGVDAVLFTEQGQVFRYFDEVRPAALHGSFGGGLRFYSRGRRTGRAEVIYSPETIRVVLQIGGIL